MKSTRGQSRENETHERDVVLVAGQFKLLAQTLYPCETYVALASQPTDNLECVMLTDVSYEMG